MSFPKQYAWEVTHITSIVAVITTLTLVIHLTGTPRTETHRPGKPTTTADTDFPGTGLPPVSPRNTSVHSRKTSPSQITVGPSGISNRYTLLSVDRKPSSATLDQVTVKLQVESLAIDNLVSPFESDMIQLVGSDSATIEPNSVFRHPVPSGNSLTQDIVFTVPTGMNLSRSALRIHYYNYQNEISLNVPPAKGAG